MTPETLGALWGGLSGVDYRAAGGTIAQVAAAILSVYVASSLVIFEIVRQRYGRSYTDRWLPLRSVWPSVVLSGFTIFAGVLTSFVEAFSAQFWMAFTALVMLVISTAVIAASVGASFRDSMSDEVLSRRVEHVVLADFSAHSNGPDWRVRRLSETVHGRDDMSELTAVGSVFIRSGDWQALGKMNDIVQKRVSKLAVETDSREVHENMVGAMCLMWDQLASEALAAHSMTAVKILILAVYEFEGAWNAARLPLVDLRRAFDPLESLVTRALSNGMRDLLEPGLAILETLIEHNVSAAKLAVAGHPTWSLYPPQWGESGIDPSPEEEQALMDWFWGAEAHARTLGSLALECARLHDEEGVSHCLGSLERIATLAYDDELHAELRDRLVGEVFSQANEVLLAASIRPRPQLYPVGLAPYTFTLLRTSLWSAQDGSSDVTARMQDLLRQVDLNSRSLNAIVNGAVDLARGVMMDDRTAFPESWLTSLETIAESVVEVLQRTAGASPAAIGPLVRTTAEACAAMLADAREQFWQEAVPVLEKCVMDLKLLASDSF